MIYGDNVGFIVKTKIVKESLMKQVKFVGNSSDCEVIVKKKILEGKSTLERIFPSTDIH